MNERLFFFFYNLAHQNTFFDMLVVFLAEFFPYLVIMLAGLFLLFHHEVFKAENPMQVIRQKYKEMLLVFLSGVAAWTLAHVVKYFFQEPRPFEAIRGVYSLFEKSGYSFPSGHAAFFTALAISIYFSHKKAGYVFAFFALLIGTARIIAGVHFPLDILGGFLLGAVVAYLVKKI